MEDHARLTTVSRNKIMPPVRSRMGRNKNVTHEEDYHFQQILSSFCYSNYCFDSAKYLNACFSPSLFDKAHA